MDSDIDDESSPLEKRIKRPVEQWLRSFDDAEFVLTDSFHGCVFSIIFQKNFVVLKNEGRGLTRFNSLLGIFSLEDRLVSLGNYDDIIEKVINYKDIDKRLSSYRVCSMDYLKKYCHS